MEAGQIAVGEHALRHEQDAGQGHEHGVAVVCMFFLWESDQRPRIPSNAVPQTQPSKSETKNAQGEEREGVGPREGDAPDPERQRKGQRVHGQVARYQRLHELILCGSGEGWWTDWSFNSIKGPNVLGHRSDG